MGDRCYMQITVAREFAARFSELGFDFEYPDDGGPVVEITDSEANYGHSVGCDNAGFGDDAENGAPPQSQAFGLADLFGDGGELGYISIAELIANGAELDLHWTPKPLSEISTK